MSGRTRRVFGLVLVVAGVLGACAEPNAPEGGVVEDGSEAVSTKVRSLPSSPPAMGASIVFEREREREPAFAAVATALPMLEGLERPQAPGRRTLEPVELGGSCAKQCLEAADCLPMTATVITDLDNYRCEAGRCEWLGCLDDAECDALFGLGTRTCVGAGSGAPSCVPRCSTAADCVADAAPATMDDDNYACAQGACIYQGCKSDEECADALGSADFACASAPGALGRTCLPRCEVDRDCALGVSGWVQDHCVSGVCVRAGCLDDAECQVAFDQSFACFERSLAE